MLSKNVLAASLLFASFQAVFAAPQTATVSIAIDVGDSEDADAVTFQGEIGGVGSDGTTYILSYAETYTDDDISTTEVVAETFTVVQDATRVSYEIIETADSMSYKDAVVCGLDASGNGVCTEVYEENDTLVTESDTYTTSGSVLYYAAEITGSGATATASASGSSGTSKGSSSASTGKASGSSASGSSSASASGSSSSASSGASTVIASGFVSVLAALFGVALLL